MSRWKSPRAAPHYARNTAAQIRRVSRAVLAARSEARRIALLTSLHGVSVPVASAILTLIDPKRYGVLDIRVWQLLHALGAVDGKPGGRGFGAGDWESYLACLRPAARGLGVSVRIAEYTLFHCHRAIPARTALRPAEAQAEVAAAAARRPVTARSMSGGSGARCSAYRPVDGWTKPSTAACSMGRPSAGSAGIAP